MLLLQQIRQVKIHRILILLAGSLAALAGLVVLGAWLYFAQPLLGSNRPSAQSIDSARLRGHVVALSQTFHPRNHRHVDNLNRCADYIGNHFRAAGAKVSEQKYEVNGNTYRNVIGVFGEDAGPRIVVGAHYDSFSETPGADDNASGVAGLIELAFLLGRTNLPIKVELVAYTLEEPPFFGTENMGSYRHARALSESTGDLALMISLEMIGYFSDMPGSQSRPTIELKLLYPDKGNFIGIVGRNDQRSTVRRVKRHMKGAADVPVYSLNAPLGALGIDMSDHRNYWNFGYDAVMITDSAPYRNTAYHADGDTAETLDYERMSKVVIQVYEAVTGLASQPGNE